MFSKRCPPSIETSIFLQKKPDFVRNTLPIVEDFLLESPFSFHLATYFWSYIYR